MIPRLHIPRSTRRIPYQSMVEVVPEKQVGIARVQHFEISEAAASFSRVRMAATRGRELPVTAGKFARLFVGSDLMMTDTDMERSSNVELIDRARGNVLIAGLGLGMVLVPLLKKAEVNTILVIEKYKDVIDLVAPSFQDAIDDERLHIFHEDIFKWTPPEEWLFDTIYFDIWPEISGDNYVEMCRLHNGFRFSLANGGWMESWLREDCAAYAGVEDVVTSYNGVEFDPEDEDEDE